MTFVISCAPLNLVVASSADVNVLFSRTGGGGMVREQEVTMKSSPFFSPFLILTLSWSM